MRIKLDKKNAVIFLVTVVVICGAYYGINHWRQQRLAGQILQDLYGVKTGVLNKLAGGVGSSGISNQVAQEIAKEMAKEEARQKSDEAKEAAKTPEDKYNETEEMPTYDANSKAVVAEAKNLVEKVFGKAKLTSVATNIYGSDMGGSGVTEFKIARLTTGADLGTLNKVLTDNGLPIIQSGIDNKTVGVMAGTNNAAYSFGFEIGEQTVGVNIMKSNQ